MVHGMEVFVEEFVHVHPTVKEILPSVDNESFGFRIEIRMQSKEANRLTERKTVVQRVYPTSIANM